MAFPKMAQYTTREALQARCQTLGLEFPFSAASDAELAAVMGRPWKNGGWSIGNRWCIHPMEGWDASEAGLPSEWTLRRWERFGGSGAKLIWGGEASAVEPEGRANPRQLLAIAANRAGFAELLRRLRETHRTQFGTTDDLCVGLQLTHSGRYARPNLRSDWRPKLAYHHPLLDQRQSLDPNDESLLWRDSELASLIECYVEAAKLAEQVGFDFVDIKACHGYLLHEFLTAHDRPGRYGGDWEGRTRLLLETIEAVQAACPHLKIGVRLSLFDAVPYHKGVNGGEPMTSEAGYRYAFGRVAGPPFVAHLEEPLRLLQRLKEMGVTLVNLSCGSPYYNPHLQRPAAFPPSDGYPPPEDPLVGVARQIFAVRECKQLVPGVSFVGSGYTYLQQWLPYVAGLVVQAGWADFVGIGRMVLSYPELPRDSLSSLSPERKRICRTFSDCTTAPRSGLISGCYPLDEGYSKLTEANIVKKLRSKRY